MSFRTTSTGMPCTSIWCRLVVRLVPRELKDAIHQAIVIAEDRFDGAAYFPFLESISTPVGLLDSADRIVHVKRQSRGRILGQEAPVGRRVLTHRRFRIRLEIVIQRPARRAVDAGGV